jgi:orotidine-5'-phosphate decarboxylase
VIYVALDFPDTAMALDMARQLKGEVGGFKVGLELYTATGPDILKALRGEGVGDVFLDLKFHDIPATVKGAAKSAVRAGAQLFNVHCPGATTMMKAAVEGAREQAQADGWTRMPAVIGVTLLTSINDETLKEELGVEKVRQDYVVGLAQLAQDAGLDGVVCSAQEVEAIDAVCGPNFLTVVPAIRLAGADKQDQQRTGTPGWARKAGARRLVIGRPITQAEDPIAAAKAHAADWDAAA